MALRTNSYSNAIVLPPQGSGASPLGGVCSSDFAFIDDSCPNLGAGGKYIPTEIYKSESKVVYIGWINQVWGHTITDVLKKIWFVSTEECRSLLNDGYKLIYVTHCDEIPEYVKQFLSLAGFNLDYAIRILAPTQFENVVIPEDCFVSYGDIPHFTQEYVDLIDYAKSNISLDIPVYEKIYFTRTQITKKFSWRTMWMPKDVGEEEVENEFRRCGYKIIAPERLSIQEQIYLLMNCRQFAATEGSVSHNAIFCTRGTRVCILKKEKRNNIHTVLTIEAAGVNAEIIDCNASYNVKSTYYGPFYLRVTPRLKKFLGVGGFCFPFWLKPLWYWYMAYDTAFGRTLQKLLRIV